MSVGLWTWGMWVVNLLGSKTLLMELQFGNDWIGHCELRIGLKIIRLLGW